MSEHPPARYQRAARARRLRREAPIPERILWNALRGGRIGGLKFRRQHPIGPFIADFYCHEAKLVVELDGMSHDQRQEYDDRRTAFFAERGIRVFRVMNDDVLTDVEAVVRGIASAAGIRLD